MACILLVDDDENLLSGLRVTLERRGHQILEARNGREAVALYREKEVDLIITDVLMPGLHGPELAQKLVASHPDLRVLYMSGYTAEALLEADGGPSVDALLNKPFKSDELVERIRAVLDELGDD